MFRKILVANRGEIAVRIIRACQEMGIATVAVYADADAQALHTALADEAVHIGPSAPAESYLRADKIVQAAQRTGAEAVHPGYGFLSENADFARAVTAAGLVFIGPGAAAMHIMGSKTSARAAMAAAGVPVVPGYQASQDDADLVAAAAELGYPVLVKAVAGGGGKGMRIVPAAHEFPAALESARREAGNAFGDTRIYLEKLIEHPRHVEMQILADHHGNVIHLFERECSVQRRHQKIVEESPAPCMTAALRARMGAAAVSAAHAVGYANAGTLEFLVDQGEDFYFLEMNTRLQVEHPVTELVTGVDLVKAQIRVAAGEPLPFTQDQVHQRGHAIECRIYAEDPANDFLPAIGTVLRAVEPVGPGVRVDAGITTGDTITLHYDPMIAKLVVLGEDRADAIGRMQWALRHYAILGDVTTNIPFLRALLAHPAFAAGEVTTDFVDRAFRGWTRNQDPPPEIALIAAAVDAFIAGGTPAARAATGAPRDGDPYSPWQHRGAFGAVRSHKEAEVRMATPQTCDLMVGETAVTMRVAPDGDRLRVSINGATHTVQARAGLDGRLDLEIDGRRTRAYVAGTSDIRYIAVEGDVWPVIRVDATTPRRRGALSGQGALTATMPALVLDVLVAPGDAVDAGATLVLLEAMKMELRITAPHAGRVRSVHCQAGAVVARGQLLVDLAPTPD